MKKLKIASCALAAGFMMFSVVTPNAFAEDVNTQIQQQKDTLHKQQQERDEIQKQMDELKKTIQGLDKSVQENEAKLAETIKLVEDAQKTIEQKDKEIAELQTKIAQREELLRKRLVALQEKPNTNVVTEVVVNSKSIADLVDRLTSVSQILDSDQDIMKTQQSDQAKVKKDVELIKEKQKELKDAQAKIETAKKELDVEKAKKQTAIDELNAKMQTVVNGMQSTEGQLKDLEKQALYLQSLAEKAVQPAQQPAQQPANNGGGQEKPKPKEVKPNPGPTPPAPGVLGKAQQYLGMPYVWGSASPSNGGFDCSGFISYIYGVGRQDVAGYWNSTQHISDPQPGDLVFFQGTYKAGPSHIGIYAGNGQMIHAGDKGISYSDLGSSYNQKHFLGYGRF
ncbi:N-terminal domain of peptidoglycan hydrolase CwlO-containing protein [Bacillus sp. 491mf]|uniref:C40 family peptidase n=1 Tax=Bacillus sp. 491mf TaxID=1761755 RepID=UPI0008EE8E62|nr:C40 family peptidase [Bacillus sp. 491mf]SFC97138.1 N-terminal domain of peptidoglycan hydrolase CwlO-containing protein [Bacillus sp. 491mf]